MNLKQYLKQSLQHNEDITNCKSDINKFKGIPFVCEWGSLTPKYDNCCFSHIFGLPLKNGEPQPMFKWQQTYLYDNFTKHKYNWIKKATGIGASEFTLRWILWQCLVNEEWNNNGIVAIATGPNISLAKRLIARAYDIIAPFIPEAKITDYKLIVNGCEISAFPGKNMDSMRSLTNVKLVVLEEADFFSPGEQLAARTIAERYIGKSDTSIIMLSTPGAPNGLYQQIEEEENCIYNKIYLPYTIGLGTIFTKEEIAKAMQSFSFASEYDLQYLGRQGNVYNLADIAAALEDKYDLSHDAVTSRFTPKYMSIDPAWGSSDFAILIAQWRDSKLEIIYENSISRPSFSEMIKLIQHLLSIYPNIKKVICDSSQPGLIKELKVLYNDPYPSYEKIDPKKVDSMLYTEIPKFVPFNYASLGKQSLKHSYKVLNKGLVRINPKFNMLITGLKTAVAKGEWDLDKSSNGGSYQDIVDTFRQICMLMRDRGQSSN